MQTIRGRERSTLPVSSADYRLVEDSLVGRDLLESGIISLVRSKSTPYGLRCGAHVGSALLTQNVRLVIEEKVPGSLRALLDWAVTEDVVDVPVPSVVDLDSPVLGVFARQFLSTLGMYLRRGRLKQYRPSQEVGPIPRGKIDLRVTLAMEARGRSSVVGYSRRALTGDLDANRLIALALSAIEGLVATGVVDAESATRARSYGALFSDVSWQSLRRARLSDLETLFQVTLEQPQSVGALRAVLLYARALILNLGAWPDDDTGLPVPDAFFLNLERLFEDAVRAAAVSLLPSCDVVKGRRLHRPLFMDRPQVYIADPDFVATAGHGDVVLTADAKYKDLDGLPAHSDVYQIAAHAHALGGESALLVYPAAQSALANVLGRTSPGCTVAFCMVRLDHLGEDLASGIDLMLAPIPLGA